jgi:hypothetical protein
MKDSTLTLIGILLFLAVVLVLGGLVRGCSNDIDGADTFEWWAW